MSLLRLVASTLYGVATDLRRMLYDNEILSIYYSPLPVISVGNVTIGGNGKSPFTAYIAERLRELGYQPVILLRGYRGRESGPYHVRPSDSPSQVGDEALMHARRFGNAVAVVVSRKRAVGARFIEEQRLGDVILLDDGFQHRALGRQLDLVLWASSGSSPVEEMKHERLLPLGRLRERIKPALARAQALIWVQKGSAVGSALPLRENGQLPQYYFELKPSELRDVFDGAAKEISSLRGNACRCVTAIAEPESFARILSVDCGARVAQSLFKRDHDLFSPAEWRKFSQVGEGAVVCTEKDEEKLRGYLTAPGQLYSLRLSGSLGVGEDALLGMITDVLPAPKLGLAKHSVSL